MGETAIYVYCLVGAASRPAVRKAPPGLPGAAPLALVDVAAGLWLAAAEVPLGRYGSDALERGLRDMDWVAGIAVAHEAVVEHFARRRGVTVVPMKLFTLFSTADRAVAEMRSRRREIRGALKRLERCEEWGVRVLRGRAARPSAPDRTSGAAFLRARKQARDDAREAVRAAAESAEKAFELLVPIAREARRRDETPAGAVSPPLLDAAFLVPAAGRARFRTAARKAAAACARAGAAMTLSGPWPAYNFVQPAEGRR